MSKHHISRCGGSTDEIPVGGIVEAPTQPQNGVWLECNGIGHSRAMYPKIEANFPNMFVRNGTSDVLDKAFQTIHFDGTQYVGYAGDNTTAQLYTSPDGLTWTAAAAMPIGGYWAFYFEPVSGVWLATVGTDRTPYKSTDLVTWTPLATPVPGAGWLGVLGYAPSNGKIYASKDYYTVEASLYSTVDDGATWVEETFSQPQMTRMIYEDGSGNVYAVPSIGGYLETGVADGADWSQGYDMPMYTTSESYAKLLPDRTAFLPTTNHDLIYLVGDGIITPYTNGYSHEKMSAWDAALVGLGKVVLLGLDEESDGVTSNYVKFALAIGEQTIWNPDAYYYTRKTLVFSLPEFTPSSIPISVGGNGVDELVVNDAYDSLVYRYVEDPQQFLLPLYDTQIPGNKVWIKAKD